ncbi:MAG: lipopolysaccharide biosynthesis protein [Candidatus Aureabacteria bacterium]|nr:lipopolysaccharide biosynthesis protein [Candidatus Auribacterota bacterium]
MKKRTLKEKTVSGLIWSFVDNFAVKGLQFAVGVILARILSPKEFGLVGILAIFIAISQSFIDSGFSQALIRKKDCSQADYSTVFYFNFVVGIIMYALLFLLAKPISLFFNEPILKQLIRVFGLSVIFISLDIIQRTIISKELNFKLMAQVSFFAYIISGIAAIVFAHRGWGVWSLVILTLGKYGLTALFMWIRTHWRPSLEFSIASFKELFSFGSKLLVSGLINAIFRNVYYVIIGKYFTAIELGYYTRADNFKMLPSENITQIIQRVSYPVLSSIKDDTVRLKENYRKLIKSTMLITFVLMFGLAAVARPMILALIGEKWLPSVIYLQLLCFVGMFYPLHALNLNMLQVEGRSDLILRLEIIKKCLTVPIIVIGIFYGIKIMIVGMIINTIIAYYLNSYWSGKFIGYSTVAQIKDFFPLFIVAAIQGGIVFFIGKVLSLSPVVVLSIQLTVGALITIALCELVKIDSYSEIKTIIIQKLKGRK